jgi:hypothetical protein
MKTQNSKSTILWKKVAIVPLLAGLFFLFADRVEAQRTKVKDDIAKKLNEINKRNLNLTYLDTTPKATEAQMKEYNTLLNSGEKNNIYKLKDVKRMQHIYSIMSESQKTSVKHIDSIIPPPPQIIVIDGKVQGNAKKLPPPPPPRGKEKLPPPPPRQKKSLKEVEKISKNNDQHTRSSTNPKEYIVVEYEGQERKVDLSNLKTEEIEYLNNNPKAITIGQDQNGELIEIMEIPVDLNEEEEIIEEELEIIEELPSDNIIPEESEIVYEAAIPYDFEIILEKKGRSVKAECIKGCNWKKLAFTLNRNSPKVMNKRGVNMLNQRNKDEDFHFILMQNKNIFELKSFKNTEWKGLSASSKEDMKLLITPQQVRLQ